MADLISPKALSNKFFINSLAAGRGMQALMRGQIIGPIGVEFSPFYLCRVFPADDDEIEISTETVLALEQLVGVYFYDDRQTLDAAWSLVQRKIAVHAAKQRRERKALAKKQIAEITDTLKHQGINVVKEEEIKDYVSLRGGAIAEQAEADDD
jgi:hypothetical protein